MRAELAILYIDLRMKEMGFDEYETHLRHIGLRDSEVRKIEAGSDLWVLCEEQQIYNGAASQYFPGSAVRIASENGVFDLRDSQLLELEHEHTGIIVISNHSKSTQYVMFLQATPKILHHDTNH